MKLYIPENLKLDELISNKSPDFRPFKRDSLCYILHLIYTLPLSNKKLLSKNFIPINATLLKEVIKNYKDYLIYLEKDLNIIESDNQYIVGEKSKGFRFSKEYRTKVKEIPIVDFTLWKSLNLRKKRNELTVRNLGYLTKWFNAGLEIDFDKAKKFLNEEYKLKMDNKYLCDVDNMGKYISPLNQYNHSFISAEKIHRKDFNVKMDDNVMRLHSNLTNMRTILRNALTYKGEKLYSLDLKNSQPYLTVGILNNNIIKILKSNYNSYYIMLGEMLGAIENKGFDEYIDLVIQGKLYDFLGDKFTNELGLQFESRREVKQIVFQVLFTDNRFIGQKEAMPKKLFKKSFPEVYEVFSKIKKKDSTLLPRLLQYVESRLFIAVIAKRISKEMPEAPIYTIHDSIATTEQFVERVRMVIIEELEKTIGYKPTLEIEKWDSMNLDIYLQNLTDKIKNVA